MIETLGSNVRKSLQRICRNHGVEQGVTGYVDEVSSRKKEPEGYSAERGVYVSVANASSWSWTVETGFLSLIVTMPSTSCRLSDDDSMDLSAASLCYHGYKSYNVIDL